MKRTGPDKGKRFTITTSESGSFSVGVGDKVVVVSKTRNAEVPDHRLLCTVADIRGGKTPRIELVGSAQTFDTEGKSGWRTTDRVEPYDAEKEARLAKEAENMGRAAAMATRLSVVGRSAWLKICLDPVRRELLDDLIKEATNAD